MFSDLDSNRLYIDGINKVFPSIWDQQKHKMKKTHQKNTTH